MLYPLLNITNGLPDPFFVIAGWPTVNPKSLSSLLEKSHNIFDALGLFKFVTSNAYIEDPPRPVVPIRSDLASDPKHTSAVTGEPSFIYSCIAPSLAKLYNLGSADLGIYPIFSTPL